MFQFLAVPSLVLHDTYPSSPSWVVVSMIRPEIDVRAPIKVLNL